MRKLEREQEKVPTSIRIPENTYEYIQLKSKEMGISQNDFMLMLIHFGKKVFDCNITLRLLDN